MSIWRWLFGETSPKQEEQDETFRQTMFGSARVQWRNGSFPMEAVGESHHQNALSRICGGHSRHGYRIELVATIEREPQNKYDKNAVAVKIHGAIVGHLPREHAIRISSQMVDDGISSATCNALVVGGWRTNQHDEGSFGVKLAIPRFGWIDFGLGKAPPEKRPSSQSKNTKPRPTPAASGPLSGEWVVIWGGSHSGNEAYELANLGAHIMAGIGKSTTMLVHIEDELTSGMIGSATFKKAKARIDEGAALEIISMQSLRSRLRS